MAVEGKRSRQKTQIEEAGPFETPCYPTSAYPTSAALPTGDAASGSRAEDPENRSRSTTGQGQQETSNKWNNTAKSSQNCSIDKNNFAQNLELGELACARDASKEGFNLIPGSQTFKSDDVMVGELDNDESMDENYITQLLNLEGPDFISCAYNR